MKAGFVLFLGANAPNDPPHLLALKTWGAMPGLHGPDSSGSRR
jgi:hypothetical protein